MIRVRVEVRVRVSENTFKYVFGQTFIRASIYKVPLSQLIFMTTGRTSFDVAKGRLQSQRYFQGVCCVLQHHDCDIKLRQVRAHGN